MRRHKVLSVASSHSRHFGACAEGSGDLDDIGKFVQAVTVIEEHDLGGVDRRIAGNEGSNLRLDVGVQHAHNSGDKRQSDVVPPEGLRRVLERFPNATHVHCVIPVLVRDRDACPPLAVVCIYPPYTCNYMPLCPETLVPF